MTSLNNNIEIKKLIIYCIIYLMLLMGLFYCPHLSGKSLDVIKVLYLLSVIPLTAIIFISNKSNFIWVKRIIIYFIVMVVSLFLSSIISYSSELFLNVNIDVIDIDNARYMLSSLIQSEAAIVAIVITLTLVAVQQTSTLYSTRLIDIFKSRNPDFWILIIIYLGSITYQLIILTDLNKSTIEKNHIFFSFFAGLFSFISLIPYMLNTIDLLKPLTMLTILSEKITKSNFLLIDPNYFNIYNYCDLNLKSVSLDNNIKDPILPLVDIINSSLMKNDYDTSRDGLLIIRKCSIQILDDDNINDREFENIYKLFSKYFFSIGNLAISKRDDVCAVLVIDWFYEVAMNLAKKQKDSKAGDVLSTISDISKIAAQHRNKGIIISSIRHYENFLYRSSELNVDISQRTIASSLIDIGESIAENKIKDIIFDVLCPLSMVLDKIIKEVWYDKEEEEEEEEEEEGILNDFLKELDRKSSDYFTILVRRICRIAQVMYEKNMTEDLEEVVIYINVIKNNAKKYGKVDAFNMANDFLKTNF